MPTSSRPGPFTGRETEIAQTPSAAPAVRTAGRETVPYDAKTCRGRANVMAGRHALCLVRPLRTYHLIPKGAARSAVHNHESPRAGARRNKNCAPKGAQNDIMINCQWGAITPPPCMPHPTPLPPWPGCRRCGRYPGRNGGWGPPCTTF